jgi:hypothetical protein
LSSKIFESKGISISTWPWRAEKSEIKTRENQISKTKMAGINQKQLQRLIILIVLRRRLCKQNEKSKKQFWMRKIYQECILKGELHLLIKEIILFDHKYLFRCFRMVPATFEKLLSWVSPYIQKKTTKMCEPVSPVLALRP